MLLVPHAHRLRRKIAMALHIWFSYLVVRAGLRRWPLPELVCRIIASKPTKRSGLSARRLGVLVVRALHIGRYRARCLAGSLVLFRLLRQEGVTAQLVIGLPERPTDQQAHAWVEVDEADVGPPPGRNGHVELARYG